MSNSDAVNDLIDHEEDHNMAFWELIHGLCYPMPCYYCSQPQEGNKMARKRIKISSAKAKGRGLQQWACKKISELTGYEYGSSGDDKPIESRPMGQMGCDVRMESQVKKLFPYSVECKRCENWSIPAWIKQAKENQMQNTDWLLIIKKSHEDPIAIIDANLFFEIQGALLFWKNKAKIKGTP